MAWGSKSRHERGYGKEWDQVRKVVLARDCGLCQVCLKKGAYTTTNIVDHIMSKANAAKLKWSKERTEHPDNLQAICKPCHDIKTEEEQGKALRPKVQIGEDGWPVPE
ncbi:HNH endonuclease [Massilia sp. RP-1-19]|uniref:Putative HNH nuclease YajD n=1 Tax=Massilia polaris TaxID=2728846 RepID=A0A848HK80_9BURK|nr:HNH endonuclease [Massilia polaris]NML61815.1 HNH endonuclease [Massilia polaris]